LYTIRYSAKTREANLMDEESPNNAKNNADSFDEISEIPLNADAEFYVSENGITELLVYNYLDGAHVYQDLCASENFEEEIDRIKDNMQFYLNQDTVLINSEEKRMKLSEIELKFKDGVPRYPQLCFMIIIRCKLQKGTNVIEFYMEEEDAPYDFQITWHFPRRSAIIEVETLLSFELTNNKIVMTAKKGDPVGGYEKIVFKML
jgi:hypothetical protein